MDSGMNTTPIYNLEERLELGIVPLDKDLTTQQKIGVMDQLMACEVNFLEFSIKILFPAKNEILLLVTPTKFFLERQ